MLGIQERADATGPRWEEETGGFSDLVTGSAVPSGVIFVYQVLGNLGAWGGDRIRSLRRDGPTFSCSVGFTQN